MAVIIIVGVMFAFALPGFETLSLGSRRTNAIADVSGMISRARSEAASRNANVVLCVSTDQSTCSGAATWESGWLMFVDNGAGGGSANNKTRDGAEPLIAIGQPTAANTTLRAFNFPTANAVMVLPTGMMEQSGTFVYCDKKGIAELRAINVSVAGQVRIANDVNNTGKVEDSNNADINSCT